MASVLVAGSLAAGTAHAWNLDQDANKIDDRIDAVEANGWAAAFEDLDPSKRMAIGVFAGNPIQFAIYVGYDHHPTA
ncbi:MAG TPA: hypothetical protein VI893_04835, partial [Thermoplasmata archaeon]|nr:hypothetical protein [Thermoplasmata archaeon]